jgi:UDP-glucose:(heptosyl)LPS alpha-1,3-glucosyltransferase
LKKTHKKRLTFAIHDLNAWGGHDRSTLEIARRLSHYFGVDLFIYSITDPEGLESWGDVQIFKLWPYFKKPAFALITYFYLASYYRFGILKKFHLTEKTLIHSTGACSLISDVVQVQFVNTAWKEVRKKLPNAIYQAPHARSNNSLKSTLLNTYHNGMLSYDAAIEKKVYRPEKTYIAISKQVAGELSHYFGLKDRVQVIHHGVDGKVFCPMREEFQIEREKIRSSLNVKPTEVALAFVGAYERKGLSIAIEALGQLPKNIQVQTKLLAIGSGAQEGFKARAQSLGILDRICFVQHIKKVAPYYRAADLFFLPTLYEPFGLVILEALASGLPSLISAQAGGSELITHEETGFLIQDPLQIQSVSKQLEQLITQPTLREKIGKQARLLAEKRSWDTVAQEYAHTLEPLLLK